MGRGGPQNHEKAWGHRCPHLCGQPGAAVRTLEGRTFRKQPQYASPYFSATPASVKVAISR
jgi:hypothetical protein